MRFRLKEERDEALKQSASMLRSGNTHSATVQASKAKALEEVDEWITETIIKAFG